MFLGVHRVLHEDDEDVKRLYVLVLLQRSIFTFYPPFEMIHTDQKAPSLCSSVFPR